MLHGPYNLAKTVWPMFEAGPEIIVNPNWIPLTKPKKVESIKTNFLSFWVHIFFWYDKFFNQWYSIWIFLAGNTAKPWWQWALEFIDALDDGWPGPNIHSCLGQSKVQTLNDRSVEPCLVWFHRNNFYWWRQILGLSSILCPEFELPYLSKGSTDQEPL